MGNYQWVTVSLDFPHDAAPPTVAIVRDALLKWGGESSVTDRAVYGMDIQPDENTHLYAGDGCLEIYRDDIADVNAILAPLGVGVTAKPWEYGSELRGADDVLDLRLLSAVLPGARIFVQYVGSEGDDDAEQVSIRDGRIVKRWIKAWVEPPVEPADEYHTEPHGEHSVMRVSEEDPSPFGNRLYEITDQGGRQLVFTGEELDSLARIIAAERERDNPDEPEEAGA